MIQCANSTCDVCLGIEATERRCAKRGGGGRWFPLTVLPQMSPQPFHSRQNLPWGPPGNDNRTPFKPLTPLNHIPGHKGVCHHAIGPSPTCHTMAFMAHSPIAKRHPSSETVLCYTVSVFQGQGRAQRGSGTHRARAVHPSYSDILPDPIVLLWWLPPEVLCC